MTTSAQCTRMKNMWRTLSSLFDPMLCTGDRTCDFIDLVFLEIEQSRLGDELHSARFSSEVDDSAVQLLDGTPVEHVGVYCPAIGPLDYSSLW